MQAFHIVFALLLQAGAAPQQPIELMLDVLTIPPAPMRPDKVTGDGCGCVGGIGGRPDVPPLKVTLVRITPDTLSVGDALVFELLVQHVGQTAIPLGISRDPELAPSCRPLPGHVRTSFPLFVKDSHELIAISPGLYGSEAVAGTTMILEPGQRLRIRVPATVMRIDGTRPAGENPQALQVQAVFHTNWDKCRDVYQRSQATLPVFVSRRRQ